MNKTDFVFECNCGCGQVSEPLGQENYFRLKSEEKWFIEGHQGEWDIIRHLANGVVCVENEF